VTSSHRSFKSSQVMKVKSSHFQVIKLTSQVTIKDSKFKWRMRYEKSHTLKTRQWYLFDYPKITNYKTTTYMFVLSTIDRIANLDHNLIMGRKKEYIEMFGSSPEPFNWSLVENWWHALAIHCCRVPAITFQSCSACNQYVTSKQLIFAVFERLR
jgi:hypothetical protein